MYQQQINCISDQNDIYDLEKFAKACVERIMKNIHYRQGRFGKLSKMCDVFYGKTLENDNNALYNIRDY